MRKWSARRDDPEMRGGAERTRERASWKERKIARGEGKGKRNERNKGSGRLNIFPSEILLEAGCRAAFRERAPRAYAVGFRVAEPPKLRNLVNPVDDPPFSRDCTSTFSAALPPRPAGRGWNFLRFPL